MNVTTSPTAGVPINTLSDATLNVTPLGLLFILTRWDKGEGIGEGGEEDRDEKEGNEIGRKVRGRVTYSFRCTLLSWLTAITMASLSPNED